jgi:hypothetical protein
MAYIFQNNNFTPHSSITQIFIVIPALGVLQINHLLSLYQPQPGEMQVAAARRELCSIQFNASSASLKIFVITFSLYNLVNINSRFLQRFRNFHISVM